MKRNITKTVYTRTQSASKSFITVYAVYQDDARMQLYGAYEAANTAYSALDCAGILQFEVSFPALFPYGVTKKDVLCSIFNDRRNHSMRAIALRSLVVSSAFVEVAQKGIFKKQES